VAVLIHPVEGCIVDFEHETQINPLTGDVFDYSGNKIPGEN